MTTLPLTACHTSDSGDCGSTGIRSVTTPAEQSALASSDYRLFGQMKRMLDVQKFASDTEMQTTVRQWPASFFLRRPNDDVMVIKLTVGTHE